MAKKKPAKSPKSVAADRRASRPPPARKQRRAIEAISPRKQPAAQRPSDPIPADPIPGDRDAAPDSVHTAPAFCIVGIGASAGGLEALGQLLHALPAHPGFALVVVQHLAPRHESMLARLLGETTSLPVTEVTDGVHIEPDHVYVIAPNTEMGISRGRLRLMPRPNSRTQFNPIDYFFDSLAKYAQTRAIGIVLSGTASDGAIGLREIKGAGGFAIVQEPRTAKYDGMPRAAMATGVIDLVLAPPAMAGELMRLTQELTCASPNHPATATAGAPLASAAQAAPLPTHTLGRIFAILRKASGVDFTHYKLPTLQRRLHRRMVLHKVSTLEQYLDILEDNTAEVTSLYQDILIHVTRFFRDPDAFGVLEKTVFPAIVEAKKNAAQPVRIWVPGCSTGEEAYSIGIAALEFVGDRAQSTPIQIFATDVSELSIARARAGIYPVSISADVAPDRLRRFFNRVDGNYRVNKMVRDLCIFARQDLNRDPPFSRLDLIVCRNVLIYFDAVLQKRLMQVFHYALRPGGFLMLGGAESVGSNSDLFSPADKKHKLYTKRPSTALRTDVDFTMGDQGKSNEGGRRTHADAARSSGNVQNEANRIILLRFTPPGVIVDANWKIIQFRGQTGPYLEPAPGDASHDLLKMAREGMLYGLRTALHEAKKKDRVARKEGLRVKISGQVHEVDVEVIPLSAAEGRHFLVLFQDHSSVISPVAAPETEKEPPSTDETRKPAAKHSAEENHRKSLQQELAASREYLQSIIQDLEAANEELQSANEEILSSNEELQSTNEELDTAKEELQSTNEELNTVNEELQGRNEELSRVNSDLVNSLGSVQIAIVIVAGDLRIRRFTPMAEKVLNLIPSDVGRPISDIKPNIDCPDLEHLIHESIDTMTIKEREAKDRHGNWFMLRIRPYKNVENRIDGAVLALFDVDTSHRHVAERALAPEAVGALMEAVEEPLLILDSNNLVRAANPGFVEYTKIRDAVGRPVFEVADGKWDNAELRRALKAAAAPQDAAESVPPEGGTGATIRARQQLIGGEPMTLVVFARKESK